MHSVKYELLQVRLGRDLDAYIRTARSQGRSWRTIADDLSTVTGVDVTFETLRVWFQEARALNETGRVAS